MTEGIFHIKVPAALLDRYVNELVETSAPDETFQKLCEQVDAMFEGFDLATIHLVAAYIIARLIVLQQPDEKLPALMTIAIIGHMAMVNASQIAEDDDDV